MIAAKESTAKAEKVIAAVMEIGENHRDSYHVPHQGRGVITPRER